MLETIKIQNIKSKDGLQFSLAMKNLVQFSVQCKLWLITVCIFNVLRAQVSQFIIKTKVVHNSFCFIIFLR